MEKIMPYVALLIIGGIIGYVASEMNRGRKLSSVEFSINGQVDAKLGFEKTEPIDVKNAIDSFYQSDLIQPYLINYIKEKEQLYDIDDDLSTVIKSLSFESSTSAGLRNLAKTNQGPWNAPGKLLRGKYVKYRTGDRYDAGPSENEAFICRHYDSLFLHKNVIIASHDENINLVKGVKVSLDYPCSVDVKHVGIKLHRTQIKKLFNNIRLESEYFVNVREDPHS